MGVRQEVAFVDPKGIRNIGLSDPKISFYETVKEIEQRLAVALEGRAVGGPAVRVSRAARRVVHRASSSGSTSSAAVLICRVIAVPLRGPW